ASLPLADLVERTTHLEVGAATDRPARDEPRPCDQPGFGLERREPGELHDLVDPELTCRERTGQVREGLERVGRRDPPSGLPLGDPVAHTEPVGHVASAGATPELA